MKLECTGVGDGRSKAVTVGATRGKDRKTMIFWNDINWEELFKKYGIKFEDTDPHTGKTVEYYNPIRLFTEKDVDGEYSGVAMTCSNRSAGKTSAFVAASCILLKEYGIQTAWFYRSIGELNSVTAMYSNMLSIYPLLGTEVKGKSVDKNGNIYRYTLDGEPFGFSFALNGNMDVVKKMSNEFANVYFFFFDEFALEKGNYVKNECEKMQSLLITIARGGKSQSRWFKMIMASNNISLLNPYFVFFGIHKRYQKECKMMHGSGFVCEFTHNESASSAIQENQSLKAFRKGHYLQSMSVGDQMLIDDAVFVQKPTGRSRYLFTIEHSGRSYGVYEYYEEGYIYITHKHNPSCTFVAVFRDGDHTQNTVMLNHYDYLFSGLVDAYRGAYLRFDDLDSKNMALELLGIDLYK